MVRQFYLRHIDFNTQTGPFWNSDRAFDNFEGFFRQTLAILPNPMGIDGTGSGAYAAMTNHLVHVELTLLERQPSEVQRKNKNIRK
jgi:hypothetical protein